MSDDGNNNNPNQRNGKSSGGNRRRRSPSKRVDLWRPVPPLEPPTRIVAVDDPTVVLRSLGDLPLQGQKDNGQRNAVLVVERAARLAEGLAEIAGLLATGDDEITAPAVDETSAT